MYLFGRVTLRRIRILVGIGGIALIGYKTLPHLIPTKACIPNCAVPGRIPGERYEKLLKEVCTQMKIDSNKIQLFYNNGFSTVSAGCLSLPGPSVIGLARNCTFYSAEDVRHAHIFFDNKQIDWDLDTGKALENALLFSDNHIKFLMAHELVHIKSMDFILMALHAYGFFVASIIGGVQVASFMRGSSTRAILVVFSAWTIGLMAYIYTKKILSYWFEYKADGCAAHLGLDYSIGGIECMQKRLMLNSILRKMQGHDGEKIFSEEGEYLQARNSHPKRIDRLKQIEKIKKSFEDPTEGSTK